MLQIFETFGAMIPEFAVGLVGETVNETAIPILISPSH